MTDKKNTLLHQCVSCGHSHSGKFCNKCSERKLDPSQRKITYLLSEALEGFTSLDNRFIRSLKLFLFAPGALSAKFHLGQRVNYMKPVAFFLLVNIFYAFLTPLTDFNISFYDQLNSQLYSPYVKPFLLELVEKKGMQLADFSRQYNLLAEVSSRTLIILSAPLMAVFVALIYYKKAFMFSDHLVFSLYFYAWLMLWTVLAQVPALIYSWCAQIFFNVSSDGHYFLLLFLGQAVYWYIASRVTYKIGPWHALAKVPLGMLILIISHFLYRLVQLIVTVPFV